MEDLPESSGVRNPRAERAAESGVEIPCKPADRSDDGKLRPARVIADCQNAIQLLRIIDPEHEISVIIERYFIQNYLCETGRANFTLFLQDLDVLVERRLISLDKAHDLISRRLELDRHHDRTDYKKVEKGIRQIFPGFRCNMQ